MNRQPLILIVEQNLHELELLDSFLKSLKYNCICTKQGIRAAILAQNHQPDLIMLNMMLLDLSGSQVINYLKQDSKTAKIPIIAVVPFVLAQNQDKLFITGASDYITKPYNFGKLETLLKHYLNQLHFSNLIWE
ncbi:PleD family two-component system response regulator [Nostoc sp. TCL26-01]|uniref:response regulator n=1 Tax=Nostoc sp. TCL26-01 TaxID=2576904 RepID=UPI0015BB6651|nr:response regulator [Nostoc sp. TCL26-01]QLE54599.1 response regulator [Nostoc sp. TCL26-01]